MHANQIAAVLKTCERKLTATGQTPNPRDMNGGYERVAPANPSLRPSEPRRGHGPRRHRQAAGEPGRPPCAMAPEPTTAPTCGTTARRSCPAMGAALAPHDLAALEPGAGATSGAVLLLRTGPGDPAAQVVAGQAVLSPSRSRPPRAVSPQPDWLSRSQARPPPPWPRTC